MYTVQYFGINYLEANIPANRIQFTDDILIAQTQKTDDAD